MCGDNNIKLLLVVANVLDSDMLRPQALGIDAVDQLDHISVRAKA